MSDYEGQLNIDMYQTKDNVIIKSTVAGVRTEDLDITVANDVVTIRGSRRKEEEVVQDDYFYQECYWGRFARSISLPQEVDPESASVNFKNGIANPLNNGVLETPLFDDITFAYVPSSGPRILSWTLDAGT